MIRKRPRLIWDALPIESNNNLWGEEIYFSIPVKAGQEKGAREVVSAGELGYWPPGTCLLYLLRSHPCKPG